MDKDHDPQREAEAAMKQAVLTHGLDRQRWIRIAQAWLTIARAPLDAKGATR